MDSETLPSLLSHTFAELLPIYVNIHMSPHADGYSSKKHHTRTHTHKHKLFKLKKYT